MDKQTPAVAEALAAFTASESFFEIPANDTVGEALASAAPGRRGSTASATSRASTSSLAAAAAASQTLNDAVRMRMHAVLERLEGDVGLRGGAGPLTLELLSQHRPDTLPALIKNQHWRLAASVCRRRLLEFPVQLLSVISGIRDVMVLWYVRVFSLIRLGFADLAAAELRNLGDWHAPNLQARHYRAQIAALRPSPEFPEPAVLDWQAALMADESLVLWELEWLRATLPVLGPAGPTAAALVAVVAKQRGVLLRCERVQRAAVAALEEAPQALLAERLRHISAAARRRGDRLWLHMAGLLAQRQSWVAARTLLDALAERCAAAPADADRKATRAALLALQARVALGAADLARADAAIEQLGREVDGAADLVQSLRALLAVAQQQYGPASTLLTQLLKSAAATTGRLDPIAVNNLALLQLHLGSAPRALQILLASYLEHHPVAALVHGGAGGEVLVGNVTATLELVHGRPDLVAERKRSLLCDPSPPARLGIVGAYAGEFFDMSALRLRETVLASEMTASGGGVEG